MLAQLRPAIVILVLLTLVTGVAYPLLVTGIAQVVFHDQANGSLLKADGKVIGSELIGQPFDDPKYFFSRGSATGPGPYTSGEGAGASSGSNLGPLNPALHDAVKARIDALHAADPDNKAPVPVDLVTASASGLDPHISVAAAMYQVARVAKVRNIPKERIRVLVNLIKEHTQDQTFGLLGEPRVNVLTLNLALDALK